MTRPAAAPPRVRALLVPSLAATLVALSAATASAQGPGGPPAPFENLKVYPKDIPHDSLLGIMRGFTTALGVNCQYCHVAETVPGAAGATPRERLRPALDDKATKQTARFMIRMADSLNGVVLTALPVRHTPVVAVSCVTCHHGSPLPQTIDAALAETIARAGVDSAIGRYRQLRGDMAAGRYDFREGPVTELATSLGNAGKTAEALKLLQMNQEFHPSSPAIDLALGETYLKAGDRAQAITRYRAVLTKRPNDQRARQRLQELGVTLDPAPPAGPPATARPR